MTLCTGMKPLIECFNAITLVSFRFGIRMCEKQRFVSFFHHSNSIRNDSTSLASVRLSSTLFCSTEFFSVVSLIEIRLVFLVEGWFSFAMWKWICAQRSTVRSLRQFSFSNQIHTNTFNFLLIFLSEKFHVHELCVRLIRCVIIAMYV